MGDYINVADVRRASGVPDENTEGGMSDAVVEAGIAVVEPSVEAYFNTKFVPTREIQFLDGNSSPRIFVTLNPLLKVFSLTTNEESIDIDDIWIYKPSGMIALKPSASVGHFINKAQDTIVDFLYGWLERSKTVTTTSTAASIAGSSIALAVSSATDFAANDWVEVYGTDGNREVAQVSATDTNEVTVDSLVLTHASGSFVVKIEVPKQVKRFMELEMVVYVALNVIGGTYNFTTSYQLGDLQVTKGEPYPQWRQNFISAQQELKLLRARRKPKISIA